MASESFTDSFAYTSDEFKITDDKLADWAVRQIIEDEKERDRLIAIAQDEIENLNHQIECIKAKYHTKTSYLKSCLGEYFGSVPHKSTKTQETYQLLSGKLVFKKPSVKINHDDNKLIAALDGTEYVEIKKVLKWAEYKKTLDIKGNDVIDTSTGELVDGCTIEETAGSFDISY